MKTDLFDLEQEIMNCWHITDELALLEESVLEKDLSKDEIANVLLGLKTLYHLRFERLFGIYENMCEDYFSSKRRIAELDDCANEYGKLKKIGRMEKQCD